MKTAQVHLIVWTTLDFDLLHVGTYCNPLVKFVFRACYGAYFVAHVFKYLLLDFVCYRETCMMLLFRISVQLSVDLLITHAVCNSQHA